MKKIPRLVSLYLRILYFQKKDKQKPCWTWLFQKISKISSYLLELLTIINYFKGDATKPK